MKAEYNILFPFSDIIKDSKIVLYGAGDVGQTFYWQITNTGYCKIIAWLDQQWESKDDLPEPLHQKKDLKQLEYDFIVIAVKNAKAAKEIAQELLKYGASEDKLYYSDHYVHEYSLCGLYASESSSFIDNLAEYTGLKRKSNVSSKLSVIKTDEGDSKKIRIGFLTAGIMAEKMAFTVKSRITDAVLEAVASRDIEKSKRFSEKYGVKKCYGSYEELVNDSEIDLIHIASPAALHYEHTMLALQHGKHVLCEKPFALDEEQAKEMIALAESKHLLLADGMWTSYLPMAQKIREAIDSGVIGDVCTVSANAHYLSIDSPRIGSRELGGGVLLENGIYLLSFAVLVLGLNVEQITATGIVNAEGIDIQDSIVLHYKNKLAVLSCGIQGVSDRKGHIYGNKGYIEIQDANEYRKIVIYDLEGNLVQAYEMDGGYQYEMLSCIHAIKEGKTECLERPYQETIKVMQIADEIRKQIGVVYD